MKTTITAKNMVVTPGITNRVLKKTQTMSRYLTAETEMYIRMRREKEQRIVEITVPMSGVTLRSEAVSEDNLFQSIPSFTAGETVTSPNSLTQQSVRDYFFVKLCIFCCLPLCIVMV